MPLLFVLLREKLFLIKSAINRQAAIFVWRETRSLIFGALESQRVVLLEKPALAEHARVTVKGPN